MVGPFCFVLHSWLAGIAGRNKPLINMKAHLQRCAFCLPSFGSRFKVEVAASPPFLLGDARKWYLSHQSLVTPTIRGSGSSHMCGMRSFGSVLTCFGWGFSRIGRFPPLRMTIRGERVVSRGGGFAAFFYWAMPASSSQVTGYQL